MTKKSKIISELDQVEVRAFDLASPEHRIGALQAIIDNVCKQFERSARQSFHHLLRHPVEFRFEQQDTLKLQDYLQQLQKPSLYREFTVSPHDLHGAVSIDGDLLFFMVDLFFGGSGNNVRRHSDMSDTELRLVERFFNLALEQFANGWHSITSWNSQLTEKNTLRLGNPIQNNQLYQVCRFTIDVCGHQGWFDIALPFAGLDFLREQQCKPTDVETDPELQARIQAKLCQAPMRLMTTLCERRLSLGDVMDLKQGDVIPVELPGEVTVRAGKTPLFTARIAENNASLVLQVQDVIKQ
ncbi:MULTISPECIES: flagellar motor switch protein FliM [Photobacterium]|uniref:Flagellar motor switch protein FliM n=1 Tax=Photobacterium alginatilyticum TaxID=1775171 RepID=A0ABW9YNS3_9GAMM|nr:MULTISPECIES: flagellar motor switch protein FliM [Photobacterium]MCG7584417.1 flagellar motor switch protein FliM [Photobacterium sp. OFAV2-7]NBI55136.1 flagellar motor switch protein FliM [Photobacterium alginatilyticum]